MTIADLQSKRITVVGAARSGIAAARLLASAGAGVRLTDSGPERADVREEMEAVGVKVEFGGHGEVSLACDLMVVSPGVPSTAAFVRAVMERGTPVVSEIEAASWFCDAPIVAITGTNGKTTTTSLLGHVFAKDGRPTLVAGNIGTAFSDGAQDIAADGVAVLEVSSFQLDHIDGFRPRVGVLLNITPDHLDRYDGSVDNYADAKYRLFENMADGDALVYNIDDERIAARLSDDSYPFQPLPISIDRPLTVGGWIDGGDLCLRLSDAPNVKTERLMPVAALALRGRHNLYNSLAAAVAARVMDVRSEIVRESLATFSGVPHRLELVGEHQGVRFVNDSKATNVNAVWYALESFDREKVILIAGGRDKGNDYSALRDLVASRTRGVVAIGESAKKVMRDLGSVSARSVEADDMADAVRCAAALAEPGDVVLLSPACASFDQYDNYEHRGDAFRDAVNAL